MKLPLCMGLGKVGPLHESIVGSRTLHLQEAGSGHMLTPNICTKDPLQKYKDLFVKVIY